MKITLMLVALTIIGGAAGYLNRPPEPLRPSDQPRLISGPFQATDRTRISTLQINNSTWILTESGDTATLTFDPNQ